MFPSIVRTYTPQVSIAAAIGTAGSFLHISKIKKVCGAAVVGAGVWGRSFMASDGQSREFM